MTLRILFVSVLSCLVLSLAAPGCGDRQEDQCTSDNDCQADEVCQNGQCVARQDGGGGDDDDITCTTADDCPVGEGCLAAEGVCGTCRAAGECREGEACIDGVCGGCQASTDCNGELCDDGQCMPCQSPDDDQLCRDEYGDPDYSCQDDGNCAPDRCTAGVDCQLNGQVCSAEGRCVDCEDTYDCLDDQMGGYPAGTLCIEGVCVEGECIQSSDCPPDSPICGDDYRCRGCQHHGECLEREGDADGFVCDWDTGLCHAGDCHPPGSACGAAGDLVCSDEYGCRACQDDAECVAANGGVERFICEEGHCILGCQNAFGCTQGQVCRNNRCSSCNDDNECKEAYGDSRQICTAGTCEVGCVPDTLNDEGMVCGDDNRWRGCSSDSECQTISGLPHYFCDADGHCLTGECATNAQCSHLDDLPCTEGVCDGYVCRVSYRDGVSCSDGDLCTQTDSCQSGSCVGSNPVVCTPMDQCHLAGTCDPATGNCSNPQEPDGTSCSDGDLCTQTDTCQSGSCVGFNPVVCTPVDQCHLAGTCDPATGNCSNPQTPNGTSCVDGDECTQTDTCQSGSCVGSNPVVCTPMDQCHLAGTCDPATGSCSNPQKTNGTSCNDGDLCTQTDACQNGACVGSNPVTCTITGDEPCVLSKMCDPPTGNCVPQYKSSSVICQYEAEVDIACPDGTGCGRDLKKRTRDRYCSGNSSVCDGSLGSWSSWSFYINCENWESCDSNNDVCADTRVAGRWALCNPGEVYDVLNNLSWRRTPPENPLGWPWGICISWQDATDYCSGLGFGWRLPNINELRTIIKGCLETVTGGICGVIDPACLEMACCGGGGISCWVLDTDCKCVLSGGPGEGGCYWEAGVWNDPDSGESPYWSSSPIIDYLDLVWAVSFKSGIVYQSSSVDNVAGARCVRSGF